MLQFIRSLIQKYIIIIHIFGSSVSDQFQNMLTQCWEKIREWMGAEILALENSPRMRISADNILEIYSIGNILGCLHPVFIFCY